MKKPSLTVIIPTINEGIILKKVIDDSIKAGKNFDTKIMVVVSDRTTQETKEIAKKSKAIIVDIKKQIGKGAAVREAVPKLNTDYAIQIDADYQFIPPEIPKMMELLLSGYDVVLGTRYQKGSKIDPDSVSYFRLFGSYVLSLITSIFSKQRITDVMAGFKGFDTKILKDLAPQTDHFGYEAELVVRAAKRKYKIINMPISYKKRETGKSTVSSVKDGYLVLRTIIKTAFE